MFFLMRLSSSSLVYSGGWTITGTTFDLRDPRIIAMAQNHIMEADYDDYSVTNASSAAFCRSAALIVSSLCAFTRHLLIALAYYTLELYFVFCVQLMALLVLRHVLVLTDEDEDDASSMFLASEIIFLEVYIDTLVSVFLAPSY